MFGCVVLVMAQLSRISCFAHSNLARTHQSVPAQQMHLRIASVTPVVLSLLQLLHPQATLQLCFIACALLREAVTHQDIMTWALDGRLPFLQLPALVNQKIGPGKKGFPLFLSGAHQAAYSLWHGC